MGIAGRSEALRNDISVVNLLLTAPGNNTLYSQSLSVNFFDRFQEGLVTDPNPVFVR